MNTYLGIGSNKGNKEKNIRTAINLISDMIGIIQKISNFYLTEPWGFISNKDFLNCVVLIDTKLLPDKLLKQISEIEKQLKRIRKSSSYEDRTIDIDILFYENEIIKSENLIIPHPKLQERLFVLMPMNDISPEFIHPIYNQTISELLEKCTDCSKIINQLGIRN